MAGGTGLFPFCDIIDLLFKTLLLSTRPELANILLSNDPVLRNNPFSSFNFTIYLAVGSMGDIHPLTWAQLNELVNHPKFVSLMLRVSNKGGEMQTIMNKNAVDTKERFSVILGRILPSELYERIWVCGPPQMNAEMVTLFDTFEITPEKYLIV